MSGELQPFGKHVVADSGSKKETYRLRIVDRIREDEYKVIKSFVREMRSDLQEIDFHTIERITALAFFRSIKIEDRKRLILDAVDLLHPYDHS